MPTKKKKSTPARHRSAPLVQPLIACRDVQASSRWHCELLGVESLAAGQPSDHDAMYDRLLVNDQLLLQLHAWDVEEHPNLTNPDSARVGHGVLLWFEVEDFDEAAARAKALKAKILLKPHVNPNAGPSRNLDADPDGYGVVLASADGEVE
jgi:hypothetical protein